MPKVKFTIECIIEGTQEEVDQAKFNDFKQVKDGITEMLTNEDVTSIIISNFELKED